MRYEATDRYQALGVPYPDTETMCKGQCEGTGVYPVKVQLAESHKGELHYPQEANEYEYAEWCKAHTALNAHTEQRRFLFFFHRTVQVPCDGWHFISCEDCNGTGKAQG